MSITGTILPRRLMTPRMCPAVLGTAVMSIRPMISRTFKISIP